MDLVDIFQALGIQSKILDGLLSEYVGGNRDQADFESRFHSGIWLMNDTLKKIKPLVEATIEKGYSFYTKDKDKDADSSAVGTDTEKQVLTSGSEEVVVS